MFIPFYFSFVHSFTYNSVRFSNIILQLFIFVLLHCKRSNQFYCIGFSVFGSFGIIPKDPMSSCIVRRVSSLLVCAHLICSHCNLYFVIAANLVFIFAWICCLYYWLYSHILLSMHSGKLIWILDLNKSRILFEML